MLRKNVIKRLIKMLLSNIMDENKPNLQEGEVKKTPKWIIYIIYFLGFCVFCIIGFIIVTYVTSSGPFDDEEETKCPGFTIPSGPNMMKSVNVPTKNNGELFTIPQGYCKNEYVSTINSITCASDGKWSTPTPTCIQYQGTTVGTITTGGNDVDGVEETNDGVPLEVVPTGDNGVVDANNADTQADAATLAHAATLANAPTPTCTLPTSHSCPSTCGSLRVYEHDSVEPCIPTTYTCLPGDGDCEKCSLDSYYTFTGLIDRSVAGYIINSDLTDRWNNKPTIISSDICSAGYSLSRDITCPSQGTWSTPTPTCIQDPTQCNSLSNITSDMTDIRTTINVPTDYCNGGMTPSPSTIKCGDNGIWSTKPTCVNKTDGRGDNDEAPTATCSLDQFYKIQAKLADIDISNTNRDTVLDKLNWKGWTDLPSGGGSAGQKLVFKDSEICKQGFNFSKNIDPPVCKNGTWNWGVYTSHACVSPNTIDECPYVPPPSIGGGTDGIPTSSNGDTWDYLNSYCANNYKLVMTEPLLEETADARAALCLPSNTLGEQSAWLNIPSCVPKVVNGDLASGAVPVAAQRLCEYEYKYDITKDIYPIIIQNKDGPGFDETLHNSSLNDCENNCCGSDCFAWYFNHMNSTCGIINNLDGKYLDTGASHTELSGGKSKTHVCPAIVIPSVTNLPLSTPNPEIQMTSLCPEPMKLSSTTITCRENGTWSTPTPTCIPNAQTTPCGTPGKIRPGDNWVTDFNFNGQYNCDACKNEFKKLKKRGINFNYWEYDENAVPEPSRCKFYSGTGSLKINHNNTTSVYGSKYHMISDV
jgi:hypothetical protein